MFAPKLTNNQKNEETRRKMWSPAKSETADYFKTGVLKLSVQGKISVLGFGHAAHTKINKCNIFKGSPILPYKTSKFLTAATPWVNSWIHINVKDRVVKLTGCDGL